MSEAANRSRRLKSLRWTVHRSGRDQSGGTKSHGASAIELSKEAVAANSSYLLPTSWYQRIRFRSALFWLTPFLLVANDQRALSLLTLRSRAECEFPSWLMSCSLISIPAASRNSIVPFHVMDVFITVIRPIENGGSKAVFLLNPNKLQRYRLVSFKFHGLTLMPAGRRNRSVGCQEADKRIQLVCNIVHDLNLQLLRFRLNVDGRS